MDQRGEKKPGAAEGGGSGLGVDQGGNRLPLAKLLIVAADKENPQQKTDQAINQNNRQGWEKGGRPGGLAE